MADPRQPDKTDLAVLQMTRGLMADFDPDGYRLEHNWGGEAGMWFTEIEPIRAGPVAISLYHGGDTLNVCFDSTWFEYFPFELTDLPEIERLLRALCMGRFEQSGLGERTGARIYTSDRMWHVGHMLWPIPWRWRRKTRFEPYPH